MTDKKLAIKKFGDHYISLEHLKVYDNIIIDAGACVGNVTQAIIDKVNIKMIFCFEPGKLNFKELKKRFAKNHKIYCHKGALIGDTGPEFPVYYDFRLPSARYRGWGGIEELNKDRRQLINKYKVQGIKLNKFFSLFSDFGVNYIDFLKMDIEGTETDVVMTMGQETADKVGQISMEVHNNDTDKLTKQLNKLGFVTILKSGELYGCNKSLLK